jgi:hypothetical protein
MGHAKLAAFLQDVAQCLDDEKFDGNIIRSVMSKYINHAAITRERGEGLEF